MDRLLIKTLLIKLGLFLALLCMFIGLGQTLQSGV